MSAEQPESALTTKQIEYKKKLRESLLEATEELIAKYRHEILLRAEEILKHKLGA